MNLATIFARRALLAVCLLAPFCAWAQTSGVEDTLRFGTEAAKRGLWTEAMFRWNRVLKLDPNNAKAHNNLAVAYEREGKFEEARRHYEAALKATGASEVRENYTRFTQFVQQRVERSAAAAGAEAPGQTAGAAKAQTQPEDEP